MIAGHFGFAAAAKSRVPEVPLWALMIATVWLDVVFVPLLLAGLESAGPAEGLGPGYGHLVIHADYTHSVAGAAILALLFGLISAALWGRRAGIALGLVVMSHWVPDLRASRGHAVASSQSRQPAAAGARVMAVSLAHRSHRARARTGGRVALSSIGPRRQPAAGPSGFVADPRWRSRVLRLDFTGLLG